MVIRFKITIMVNLLMVLFLPLVAMAEVTPINVNWTSSLRSSESGVKKKLNFATPLVAGERIFVGSTSGYFYSINLVNGKKVWEVKLQGPVFSRPLFEDGTVYLGDGKGVVYSINAENGEMNWNVYIGEDVMTAPISNGDTLFVSTQNDSLFAIDKSAGAIKWVKNRQAPFTSLAIKGASDPVVIDNKVYVGNTDGVLVIYSAVDGNKLFTLPVATGRGTFTDIDTSPLKQDNRLIFSTMEGMLYSVDYKNGKEQWTAKIGTPNNIVYNEGFLYVSAEGVVYCLKVDNGDVVWKKDLDVPELSSPALGTKYVAIASTDDKLYILDKATGGVVLERHLGGGTFGTPIIADDKLLILVNNGQLYAFKFKDIAN